MPQAALPRRGVLLGGAVLALPLSLGRLLSSSEGAELPVAPADQPVAGHLVGWVTVDTNRATLCLVEIVGAASASRRIAAESWTFDPMRASLHSICRQAHDAIIDAAARSWAVPSAECAAACGLISHAGQGRSAPYTVWADLV